LAGGWRWRSDSWNINRAALREWGLSAAGIGVLLVFQLAFTSPLDAPVADRAVALWLALTKITATYGEGLGTLAGLVALPVTFFIAVALGDGGVLTTRWTQETPSAPPPCCAGRRGPPRSSAGVSSRP
jgi:hypothetical protein